MARLLLPILVLLMVALSEGQTIQPSKVRCRDRNFPLCFRKPLYCPAECLEDCEVDCNSCQPYCVSELNPLKVRCQDSRYRKYCNTEMVCPQSCPTTCTADCFTCQPVCPPPGYTPPPISPRPPPPPPVVTPSPPPPPAVTPSPSPPVDNSTSPTPPVVTPSPPPPPAVTPSPSPPVDNSTSPTPPVVTPSPPPPPAVTPSPSPPVDNSTSPTPPVVTPSPPPPPAVTPSPSPPVDNSTSPTPPVVTPSPPPPPAVTPSPSPPVVTPSPPTGTPSPPPDGSEVAGGKRVRCKNKLYPSCYYLEHRCPAACADTCEVDCVTCSPVCNCNRPGAVCQDPRFIGADGLTFYFHGKKGRDFCIVSDTNIHINAHFIGRRNENMGRDFTWVQSLGILFDNHQLSIGAPKTATWDNAVDRLELSYDGLPVYLEEEEGARWQPTTAPGVTITRSQDTNAVVIEVEGNFQIKATVVPITEKDSIIHKYGVTDEDCFAHLDLGFKFYALSDEVNGVLGQTYASNYVSRVKMGVDMPVLGGTKEFASSSLFSTDCAAARFNGTQLSSSKDFQYANMNCSSGLDGRGVVCKK